MPNQVKIYFQDYNAIQASGIIPLQEDWNLQRNEKISYQTTKDGIEAAEEAFHIFNAPEELLSNEQKMLLSAYQGPSLSVGDIVEVHPEKGTPKAYLCASVGWQEATIDSETPKKYMPLLGPKVRFGGQNCNIEVHLYRDGKTMCLRLVSPSGEPMVTATVNVPEINKSIPPSHVLIKNYSESKGSSPDQYSLVDRLEHSQIGRAISSYAISDFGSEVIEMQITDPWILDQVERKRKEVLLSKAKQNKELENQTPSL